MFSLQCSEDQTKNYHVCFSLRLVFYLHLSFFLSQLKVGLGISIFY